MSVLLVHATIFTGVAAANGYARPLIHLNVGVTLFFLISGFLLYRPYVAARSPGHPRVKLRDYARRRVLRIVPAYWVALTVLGLTVGLNGLFGGGSWLYYGFLQIYPVAWDPAHCTIHDPCGLPQAWSLAVEASFYILLPLLALGLGRVAKRNGVRAELLALGVLAAASIAFQLWATSFSYPDHPSWFAASDSLLGTFLWFALGMGVAVVSVAVEGRERAPRVVALIVERPGALWGGALVLFLLLGYVALPTTVVKPSMSVWEQALQHIGFGLIALLVLLPAAFGDHAGGLPRAVLRNRTVAWVGLISYGVFLWHFTILRELLLHGARDWLPGAPFVAVVAVNTVLALVAGAASYYVVERPFLRLKYRRRGPSAPVPPAPPELAGQTSR
jgi:peptidoglycan/LPS O-acetylase OafA/YrhL